LFGVAGGFYHEALRTGIDDARAEDFRLFQYRGAAFRLRADAQQDQLAADRGRFGDIGRLQDIDQLVHLLDHLRAELGVDVDNDGHAGQRRVQRASDGEALDVVATRSEQAGDAQ